MKELAFVKTLDTYNAVEAFMRSVNAINNVLFDIDPIGTGCLANELFDEYYFEAKEIAAMIKCGFPLVYSVKTVFETMFWKDCLSEETINTICSHSPNSSNL